jgi:hypothetical protein
MARMTRRGRNRPSVEDAVTVDQVSAYNALNSAARARGVRFPTFDEWLTIGH